MAPIWAGPGLFQFNLVPDPCITRPQQIIDLAKVL